MSDHKDPNVHAEYDGIQEQDNHLPRWWLVTLYGAMAFSVVYWQYFHTFQVGMQPAEEIAAWQEEQDKKRGANEVTEPMLLAAAAGQDAQDGAAIFKANCLACHGEQGEGKIGPNLTDAAWLHGGAPMAVHASVANGWPLKGMPAWGPVLGTRKVKQVTAYIITLKGKNLPGKAAEGTVEGTAPSGAAPNAGDNTAVAGR
jgi:cytochrome c oxidase cbb3-type subunit 3